MKKGTLLILVYFLVLVTTVVSVKVAQAYLIKDQTIHACLLADCGDPPPNPNPGE